MHFSFESVVIYDGDTDISTRIGAYPCLDKLIPFHDPLISSGNALFINFISDGKGVGHGFKIEYNPYSKK